MLVAMRDAGFSVLGYDYRGYGTSEGSPSERKAYLDAEAAYAYLVEEVRLPPGRIIVHGRSLGGAMAIELAAHKPVGGLIVESAFVSAARVVTSMPVCFLDRFKNHEKIGAVGCPVLFIHGTADRLIPLWHAERLFAAANEPKWSWWVEGAGHNDLQWHAGRAYWRRLRGFADSLRGGEGGGR